jgi:hypothetical protein
MCVCVSVCVTKLWIRENVIVVLFFILGDCERVVYDIFDDDWRLSERERELKAESRKIKIFSRRERERENKNFLPCVINS